MKPCLQAPGYRTSKGYGRKSVNGVEMYAHRAAYAAVNGPIPDGVTIDHTCHNDDQSCPGGDSCLHRGCIEPTHLEGVTFRVNALRGRSIPAKNARATHCVNDHEFTPENTYSRPGGHGYRACRTCHRARSKRTIERRRNRLIANPDLAGVVHGRVSTYTNLACRCELCSAAGAKASSDYKRRRKEGAA